MAPSGNTGSHPHRWAPAPQSPALASSRLGQMAPSFPSSFSGGRTAPTLAASTPSLPACAKPSITPPPSGLPAPSSVEPDVTSWYNAHSPGTKQTSSPRQPSATSLSPLIKTRTSSLPTTSPPPSMAKDPPGSAADAKAKTGPGALANPGHSPSGKKDHPVPPKTPMPCDTSPAQTEAGTMQTPEPKTPPPPSSSSGVKITRMPPKSLQILPTTNSANSKPREVPPTAKQKRNSKHHSRKAQIPSSGNSTTGCVVSPTDNNNTGDLASKKSGMPSAMMAPYPI